MDPVAENRAAALRLGALDAAEDVPAWDSSVDAVLIATPDGMHGPLAGQAVAAGKHVFIERPLAMNRDAANALTGAATKCGLAVEVGSETPGLSGWRAAAEVVARGTGGPLRYVQVNDSNSARGERHAAADWREDGTQHAGVFADPFYDMLAPVVSLLNPGELLKATAAGSGGPVPSSMMATLTYPDCTVVLHTGLPAPDGALAVLRGRDATLRVFPTHAEVWPETVGAGPWRHEAASVDPLNAWLAAASGSGSCLFGLDAARKTQNALDNACGSWARSAGFSPYG